MFAPRSRIAPAARRSGVGACLGLLACGLLACTGGEPGNASPAGVEAKARGGEAPAQAAEAKAEAEATDAPALHLHESGGKTFYHLELELKASDLVVEGPLMSREMAYAFSDGGQFEIYLQPQTIPVPSPDCTGGLIVRMPWTPPDSTGAEAAIEAKKTLHASLVELKGGRRDAQPVIVELNPYIEVAHDDPRSVSLTQCNLFFRYAHASYAYVDRLGPIDAEAPAGQG